MKIGGKQATRLTKRITIKKPDGGDLAFTVQALPIGFEQKVMDWIPSPHPPTSFAMRAGKVLYGTDGRPIKEVHEDDRAYQARRRQVITLQGIAFLHEGLKADREVSWDAPEPGPNETDRREAFYGAILDELRNANLTTGDIKFVIEEIVALSNNKTADIEAAREGFLPPSS